MSLEEGIASEELDNDAAYTPDIARKAPTQLQNDFWRTIVSCRDNRRVVFIIKGCRAKVDQTDLTVKENSSLTRGP